MKETSYYFFINFSPQLPQRQLPGLQNLSAFEHELDVSDFLLLRKKKKMTATVSSLYCLPNPALLACKAQYLCRQELFRDSRKPPVCSPSHPMAHRSVQCLRNRIRSFKHTSLCVWTQAPPKPTSQSGGRHSLYERPS